MKIAWMSGLVLMIVVMIPGCGELALKQKERQMELVARDWTMTIRASQVVPVYPLTQDIQVGDVYLVNRTVAAQSERYRDRGFMPTDLLVLRLKVEDYAKFYESRDGTSTDQALVLPRDWRDQPNPSGPWERFPKAGFPSYTFDVSNSGGLSIAVPVSSVPVAMTVTGAAEATGSITISEAVTYGIDAVSMYGLLRDAHRDQLLTHVTPPKESTWYLRVITRVFAAKSFDVMLSAKSTTGGGVDGGAPQPVADAGGQLENGQTVTQINEQIKNLGQILSDAGLPLPGGSLRATFADGRTVGFKETFVEPIVVGYHGFDVAIDAEGNLGRIIPTFQVLEDNVMPPKPTGLTVEDSSYIAMLDLLKTQPTETATNALSLAAKRGGFGDEYTTQLALRPNNPVEVWVALTATKAKDAVDRARLRGLVSRAVREQEIGE